MQSILIIPIFIAHRGCPHDCLFCNQQQISGSARGAEVAIGASIEAWLTRKGTRSRVQVAFFGGSFTCLPVGEQEALLSAVAPYIKAKRVSSIRLSTRPDCIDSAVCRRLREYKVEVVELGAQSLNDHVLQKSQRGHSSAQIRRSLALLREFGFTVGLQLMPGLPGESSGSFLRGIAAVIAEKPDFVRLYPTLVVKDSGLEKLYQAHRYRPLSMPKAVALTARCYEKLVAAGINVIRMGLQPTASLAESVVAGPYHPAFGELVQARIWFKKIRPRLAALAPGQKLTVHISPKDMSAVVGMNRQNIIRLAELGFTSRLTIVQQHDMARGSIEYVVG